MLMHVLRLAFILALTSVAMSFISGDPGVGPGSRLFALYKDIVLLVVLGAALMIIGIDIFIPQKSLAAISGLFFGLVVGMVVAYGLCLVVTLVVETLAPDLRQPVFVDTPVRRTEYVPNRDDPTKLEPVERTTIESEVLGYRDAPFISALKIMIGVTCCYLAVSFILQTKDDVRFVIPYVEFVKQAKGARPLVLDTSVIIDGRIADIADTRIVESELLVPRFILQELQMVADSGDKLKRNRGRRGLDILNKLQGSKSADIRILDGQLSPQEESQTTDEKLVSLAKRIEGRVVTNDYNLNKIAQLRGVDVININDLANALKPVVLPGETMQVRILKPGEEPGQGVAYLDDGTMVVVDGGREFIGKDLHISVTGVHQTSAGRMIFGRPNGSAQSERRRKK